METQEFTHWTLLKNSAESSVAAYSKLCAEGWRISEKVWEDNYMVYYVLSRTVQPQGIVQPNSITTKQSDEMLKALEDRKAQGGTVFMQTFEVVDTNKAQESILDWAKRILGGEKELQFQDGSLRLHRDSIGNIFLTLKLVEWQWVMDGSNYNPLNVAIIRTLLTYFESHKNEAVPF